MSMKKRYGSKRQWEVLRKLLNISDRHSDFRADGRDGDEHNDGGEGGGDDSDSSDSSPDISGTGAGPQSSHFVGALPRIRRRKSETFRAQYINSKEVRICVGTWNVGGQLPPDDLDIDDWIGIDEPADIYVFGLQEMIPLNAGNIFGAEDNRPVQKWENIFRESLNRIRPAAAKMKCHSDPTSPSKFKPYDGIPDIIEEVMLETDSEDGEEIHPLDEIIDLFDEISHTPPTDGILKTSGVSDSTDSGNPSTAIEKDLKLPFTSPKILHRLKSLMERDTLGEEEAPEVTERLIKMLNGTEKIVLTWPEPPLDLLPEHLLLQPASLKKAKSFKTTKSFGRYNSFKSVSNDLLSGLAMFAELDFEALLTRKRRPLYVRIVSKQMVGIFLTIWVRRRLRKHIHNIKVSTVGVGALGYIGNKGSVSVSMSIHQTFFCFVCTHLTSGEKEGDETKRNADVHEVHRKTQFRAISGLGFPKRIYDHEKIIWLGDLNYRINLPYEETCELIARKEWSKLLEMDQLARQIRKGRVFDGWSEGALEFPPTYKYENNSEKYFGVDPKARRRNPAWCDRVLSYGKGMRLLDYRRTELKLSDHRPVTATYLAEVEVFCHKKLQRALTFTNAEIENQEIVITGIQLA